MCGNGQGCEFDFEVQNDELCVFSHRYQYKMAQNL